MRAYYWTALFLAIQHSFADVRPLLSYDTRRTAKPTFGLDHSGEEFVRSLGAVRFRRRGAPADWPAEDLYCDAARAFRFGRRVLHHSDLLGSDKSRFTVAFRRFLSNGETVVRIETGLSRHTRRSSRPFDGPRLLALLESALLLRLRVPPKPVERALMHSGKALAERLLAATTQHGGRPGFNTEPWWLSSCPLMIVVEYRQQEVGSLPTGAVPVRAGLPNGANLSHLRMESRLGLARVWFLEISPALEASALRDLRLHLMRLNAERECIRRVLSLINTDKLWLDPGDLDFDELTDYLDEAAGFLSRKSVYGHSQSALLQAAYGAEDLITESDRLALARRVERLRRRVNAGVADRIERATARASTAGSFPF